MNKRLAAVIILVLAFCGIANSAYLTEHEMSSPYSHLFGISLAQYGLAFYGLLFILAALELVLYDQALRRTIQGVALAGFVASLYLTFLQIFVINALCVYCILSAVLALFIFIVACFIEPIRQGQSKPVS